MNAPKFRIDDESGHAVRDGYVLRAQDACKEIADRILEGERPDDDLKSLEVILTSVAEGAGIQGAGSVKISPETLNISITISDDDAPARGDAPLPILVVSVRDGVADIAFMQGGHTYRPTRIGGCKVLTGDTPDMVGVMMTLAVTSMINRVFARGLGRQAFRGGLNDAA